MSNKPLSNLELRTQNLTGSDLMLISQLTAAGWKSAQVTLEDFFLEMFQPGNSAGQLIANIRNDLTSLQGRFDLHENPALNTTDPNYDPHNGFYLRQVTRLSSNSGLVGKGRTNDPLAIDYAYLNTVYARYDSIVNNLTSTSATTPLSANMGRALNVAKSEISEVRKNLGGNIVSIVATTGYNMNNANPGDYVFVDKGTATVTNAPPFQQSTVYTEISHLNTNSRFQIARDYSTGQFAVRSLQAGNWSAWRKQLMEGDVGGGTSVGTADRLTTPRRINNVLFDGSADITIFADMSYNGSIANQAQEDAATTPGYYSYAASNTVAGMGSELHAILVVNKVDVNQGTIIQTRHTFAGIKYGADEIATKIARRVWSATWSAWEGVQLSSAAASTSAFGVTKLNNTLNSTSQAEALTAAMGKQLQDTKANIATLRKEFATPSYDLVVPNNYNWNNIQPGDYIFCNKDISPTQLNAPPFTYCSVYCERTEPTGDAKIAIARDALTGKQAYRAKSNNAWSAWTAMMTNVDVDNAITAHKSEANPHSQYVTQAQLEASSVGGLTEHVVDLTAVGFDQNTYYPVTIPISGAGRCNFEIDTPLYFSPAPWATHSSNSFSVLAKWSEYGSGWGAQPVERTIDAFGFVFSANSPVLSISQMINSSIVVFWVRGRAKYRLRMTKGLVPTIRTSSYSSNSETVAPKAYDNDVPQSIQQRKLDATHLSDANPHPQYALQASVSTNYYPKTGGLIAGDASVNGNFAVTGDTLVKDITSQGNFACSFNVKGRTLSMYNPDTKVTLTIYSWAGDLVTYESAHPLYSSVTHQFSGGEVRSHEGFNIFFNWQQNGSGDITNPSGQIVGNYSYSYRSYNQKVPSPGSSVGDERYCEIDVIVDYPNSPGESTCQFHYPITFKRPPVIIATRKMADKNTAGTPADGDGGALIQHVNENFAFIALQTFNGNSIGSLRGFTLKISGYVNA